jgi:cellulose synthase/poly-beta-1,6-N-acetylglucosamine synthase-like glycosyltransferase
MSFLPTLPPIETIVILILTGIYAFGILLLFSGITMMLISVLNGRTFRKYKLDENYRPMVSLIIPCHNEEEVIERTLHAFASTKYPMDKKEVIIINDGSTDHTEETVRKFAYTVITEGNVNSIEILPNGFRNVTLINRGEGGHGKSFALNSGKKYARGEGIFVIDADVQLSPDAFEKAVRHLADPKVDAVAGYVEVSTKKRNLLNEMIDFEYVIGQKILRRGYNVLGVHYIIPGGCGLFRRATLDRIGDYHDDTLAEDTDITWRLITEAHGKIHFDPSIKVIADEPATILSLWNQRVRWARGNIEVTIKNKGKAFRPKYGRALTWVYPFWLSPLILPFAFMCSALALVLAFTFNYPLFVPYIGEIIAAAFLATVTVGVMLNKGRGWIAGLLSPGIPLFTLIPMLIMSDLGLDLGFLNSYQVFGLPIITTLQFLYSIWILVAIPATYFCVMLAEKHPKAAEVLQIWIIGYWMFLLITTLEGFRRELFNEKKVWMRTQR